MMIAMLGAMDEVLGVVEAAAGVAGVFIADGVSLVLDSSE
jgi:hypothetical protein